MKTRLVATRLLAAVLLALPVAAQAQLIYATTNGTITITGYTGFAGNVTIPATVNDLPVTSIGDEAFYLCSSLTGVTIPNSVISIGQPPGWRMGQTLRPCSQPH